VKPAVADDRFAQGTTFRHEILEHGGGTAGFVEEALPHVTRALSAEEPVLVAVREERIVALREALGDDAARVAFSDIRALGCNPARIIPAWHAFLERSGDCASTLGIGEPVWPGRSEAELEECRRHETLLNLAFGCGRTWRLVCPYDRDGLDDAVMEHARSSHPYVASAAQGHCSEVYIDGCDPGAILGGELPAPPGDTCELAFGEGDLTMLRDVVARWAAWQRLPLGDTDDLVLAINELATNSIRYGGGGGTLRMWREADELLCEVHDGGRIVDPLAGRVRPAFDRHSGRGLWIVNQVCDLVQLRSSSGGTSVRVHQLLDA
jgi:anti-sigma regulatory factor (Ser/Thr protein kinase)